MTGNFLVDGRYYWPRSCTVFNTRLKNCGWDGATDRWIAKKFGFNEADVHNLKTKDHKYQAMEKIAKNFSLEKDDDATIYPVVIYHGDQIILPKKIDLKANFYVTKALETRVNQMSVQLQQELTRDKITIQGYINNLIQDRNFLKKMRVSPTKVRKLLSPTAGTSTLTLDVLAIAMDLHIEYYSEK